MIKRLALLPAFAVAIWLTIASSPALAAPRQAIVNLDGGGIAHMIIPDDWEAGDDLILFNRGFSLNTAVTEELPEPAPTLAVQNEWLERGYALAAGSYRDRGWALFDIREHQREVLDALIAEAGQPGKIYVVGGSFGGLVAAKTAEYLVADGEPVTGIYTQCAPLAGARAWDRAAQFKRAYDAVCGDVGGGSLPVSDVDPPGWILPADEIPENWGDSDDPSVQRFLARVHQCTGIALPRLLRTPPQKDRLERLMTAFGVTDETFFILNLSYGAFALADLVRDPDKLGGLQPTTILTDLIDDPTLDAAIPSTPFDPLGRLRLGYYSNPTGQIGDAKWLTLGTSRDELVGPEHIDYLLKYSASPHVPLDAANFAWSVVAESAPAHCGFSTGEYLAGFDALVDWAEQDGPAPTARVLNDDCADYAQTLNPDGRCRFNANAELPDSQLTLRNMFPLDRDMTYALLDGSWYDPAHSGEGFNLDANPLGGHMFFAWYTYPTATETTFQDMPTEDAQLWIVGYGRTVDNGAGFIDEAANTFEVYYDPLFFNERLVERWGRVEIATAWSCDASQDGVGVLGFAGRGDYGSGSRPLIRLLSAAILPPFRSNCPGALAPPAPPPVSSLVRYQGIWYGPPSVGSTDSTGLVLQFGAAEDHPTAAAQASLSWYRYDFHSSYAGPEWVFGYGAELLGPAEDPQGLQFQLLSTRGPKFGETALPGAVEELVWGTAEFLFQDCGQATLIWNRTQDIGQGFPEHQVERLTRFNVATTAANHPTAPCPLTAL